MSNTIRSLLVKIGVDLSQYTTAIGDLKNKQTQIETKFRESANAMQNWSSTSQGLALRVQSLNEKIELQKQVLNNLQAEYQQVKAAAGEDNEATKKLEQQYVNASKQLDNMNKELGGYQDALYQTAVAEGKTGTEAAEMGGKLKKAGNDTNSIKSQIKDFASSSLLQFASITGAVELAKQAFQALARLISDSAQWADDLITLSNKVNINTQSLQEMQYAAKFVDVEVETMAGSMAKLTRSMGSARDGNKELQSVFKDQLGIDIEANGQLRDKNEIFAEAIDALGQMTNATERDVLAQKIFGKSAQELNPLINAGGNALKKYANEAQQMGVVVDRGGVAVLGRLQDQFDKTQSVAETTGRNFAVYMAPVSQFFDNIWRDILKSIDPMQRFNESLYNVGVASGLTADQARTLVNENNRIMEAYNVMGVSQDEFKTKLVELMKYYVEEGIPVTDAKKQAVETLAQGYDLAALKLDQVKAKQNELDEQTQTALDAYNQKSEEFKKALESTTKKYLGQMGGLFDEFDVKVNSSKTSLDKLKKTLQKNLDDQVSGFTVWSDTIDRLAKRGIDEGLLQELRDMPIEALPEIQALNSMTDSELNHYVETFRTKQKLAKDAALKELEPMKKEVQEKLRAVEAAVAAEEKHWKEAGEDLGGGLADGITASTRAIKTAAVEAAKKALEAAKSELGINSHSRKARDEIGINYGGGVADGIVISLADARERIQSSINATVSNIELNRVKMPDFTSIPKNIQSISQVSQNSNTNNLKHINTNIYMQNSGNNTLEAQKALWDFEHAIYRAVNL